MLFIIFQVYPFIIFIVSNMDCLHFLKFQTTFYFDIHKKYFNKALDMFANFFISPLMLKDSVDREMQAVDSGKNLSQICDVYSTFRASC